MACMPMRVRVSTVLTARFTIFNFRPSAAEYMPNLEAGTQLMVEGESPG